MNWLSGLGRWDIEAAATVSGLAASQVLAQLEPLRHMRLRKRLIRVPVPVNWISLHVGRTIYGHTKIPGVK